MSARRLTDADYARLLAFRTELRRFVRFSEEAARESGLTPALHQLLLAVRGHASPDAPTIGVVAEALQVRHHTAVELVQRAERAGLLKRSRDEHDHRRIHLMLTALGADRLEDISARHLDNIGALAERLGALTQ